MTYKNISESEQTVDGVGVVLPGATCEIADETFNNPNFERVSESEVRRKTIIKNETDKEESESDK